MNRRDFFKEISQPEGAEPLARLPVVPTAGSPRQYRAGTRVLVEDARAWLCRDSLGFYAVDAHCPHLGCLVHGFEDGFACPCHHSRFNTAGERISGPAASALRYLYIDLDETGQLIICRNRAADPNDRLMA
ncbi:MAG: Rieske 2Fe-2S domain-containing protein [Chloroflexota bacterium]